MEGAQHSRTGSPRTEVVGGLPLTEKSWCLFDLFTYDYPVCKLKITLRSGRDTAQGQRSALDQHGEGVGDTPTPLLGRNCIIVVENDFGQHYLRRRDILLAVSDGFSRCSKMVDRLVVGRRVSRVETNRMDHFRSASRGAGSSSTTMSLIAVRDVLEIGEMGGGVDRK